MTTTTSTGTQTSEDLYLSRERSRSFPQLRGGHSGRLKYADPKDLPSYPSLGLKKDDAAAGAAASLGWANAKPPSFWTAPQTDLSAQRAATRANTQSLHLPTMPALSSSSSSWGNSAANQAFAAQASSSSPTKVAAAEPMASLNRQKSLRAAQEAVVAAGRRPRSRSTPLTTYPDSANAAANALSAATIATRPSTQTINIRMEDAGALPVTTMDRAMYTARPPVKNEVDARNHEAVLHASAVAMAKRMYSAQQQQQREEEFRPGSAGTDSTSSPVLQYSTLQEAAYRLAQERLARLQEEHQRNRGIAEYYGTSPATPTSPGKRLSKLSGRITRRRASSDGDVVMFGSNSRNGKNGEEDRQKSRQIRKQMSLFSARIDKVDETKRTRDREALLAAAQRNVKATLEGMDEKMSRETGRVTPAKLSEWEGKAHAAALARSEARLAGGGDSTGTGERVNLGAGKYMDREKVQGIAAKRVQPVLDEINEKAEAERQRIVALREEQEKKRLEVEAEKAKNAEIKENAKKLKEQEKQRNHELKEEAKARKEEEKAARAEEKRVTKQEKHSPRDNPDLTLDGGAAATTTEDEKTKLETAANANATDTTSKRHLLLPRGPFAPKLQTKTPPRPASSGVPTSPESSSPESATGRVKNWFRSRLHKPRSRAASSGGAVGSGGGGSFFIGGHALRVQEPGGSATSLSERSASMREVALAGRGSVSSEEEADEERERERARARARLSGREGSGDERMGANILGLEGITPPRALRDPAKASPRGSFGSSRDSKFVEIIE